MTERLVRKLLRRDAGPTSSWPEILANGLPHRLDGRPVRVLCATSVGAHPIAPMLDSLVATSLWLRGAEPVLLLCDEALPACEVAQYTAFATPRQFVRDGPQASLCPGCFARGRAWLDPVPVPLHRYSELAGPQALVEALESTSTLTTDECLFFVADGLRLGEQVRASTLRFFGKADLSSEPDHLVCDVARRYLAGALVAAQVGRAAIERWQPEVIVCHHGVYVPQGVLGEVARAAGIRVVNWGTSYRDRTVIYSHGDTYHRTMVDEPVATWDQPLTSEQEQELLDFLSRRRRGEGDWEWVTPESALRREQQDHERLLLELGLDPQRPIVGLLTNVLWDAQLYYEGHAFADMLEWLWYTIDYFADHPELQLLVRIHPHEVKQGNRQPVGPEITARYPDLPENVRIVQHDHPFNTYALTDLCCAVLIYGTKTGVELAPLGQPVIVAADAWIRGKGLTYDASSASEYRALLDRVTELGRLDAATIGRARSYAYHYFFRRMIPMTSFEPGRQELTFSIQRADDLLPGRDRGLDVICGGILDGREFVFDE